MTFIAGEIPPRRQEARADAMGPKHRELREESDAAKRKVSFMMVNNTMLSSGSLSRGEGAKRRGTLSDISTLYERKARLY